MCPGLLVLSDFGGCRAVCFTLSAATVAYDKAEGGSTFRLVFPNVPGCMPSSLSTLAAMGDLVL